MVVAQAAALLATDVLTVTAALLLGPWAAQHRLQPDLGASLGASDSSSSQDTLPVMHMEPAVPAPPLHRSGGRYMSLGGWPWPAAGLAWGSAAAEGEAAAAAAAAAVMRAANEDAGGVARWTSGQPQLQRSAVQLFVELLAFGAIAVAVVAAPLVRCCMRRRRAAQSIGWPTLATAGDSCCADKRL